MLLRAQAIGQDPHLRFVIRRMEDDTFWNGTEFAEEFDNAQKFYRPSDACFTMQDILKEHYNHLPVRKFVVPIEIDVFGDVSKRDIAEYLHRASILSIRTEDFGNGPIEDSYIAPVIHWGFVREICGPVKGQMDELAADWDAGSGLDLDDL